jgi:integrase/recombinase XerD
MIEQAVSPLRRRMIEDMTIRQFTSKIQHDYVRAVRAFAVFLGHSPDMATTEDLRRYQLHMASRGVAPTSGNRPLSMLFRGHRRCYSTHERTRMSRLSGECRLNSPSLTTSLIAVPLGGLA